MQYCSLNDAWKNDISIQYKQYNSNKKPLEINFPTNIETFSEPAPITSNNKITCDRVMNHISKCKKCQQKLKEKYGYKQKSNLMTIFDNLHNIVDEYKDMIVLILIGIMIIIILNMISNAGKQNNVPQMYGGGFVPIPIHYYPQLGYSRK